MKTILPRSAHQRLPFPLHLPTDNAPDCWDTILR